MWQLTSKPHINSSLSLLSPARLWNNAMTSRAVMSFIKIFPDRCSGKSAIARERWFTGCCPHWQLRDRETIDFLFLSFPLWLAPGRLPVQVGGGGGCSGGSRCGETLINGEEGKTRPRQGYGLETSACAQHELIYTFVKPAQTERLFTFSQAADFCSKDRNPALLIWTLEEFKQKVWMTSNQSSEKTKRWLKSRLNQ